MNLQVYLFKESETELYCPMEHSLVLSRLLFISLPLPLQYSHLACVSSPLPVTPVSTPGQADTVQDRAGRETDTLQGRQAGIYTTGQAGALQGRQI